MSIHFWAGNLLMNTGAFEDAVIAYSNSQNKEGEISIESLIFRAKCYIILKELNLAINDLYKIFIESEEKNLLAEFDVLGL